MDKPTSNQAGKRPLLSHFDTPVTVWLELKGPAAQSPFQCNLTGRRCDNKAKYCSWDCTIPVKTRAVPCSAGSDSWCTSFSLHLSQCCSFTVDKVSWPFMELASCPLWQCCGYAPFPATTTPQQVTVGGFCSPFSHKLKFSVYPKAINGCFHSAHNPLSSLSQAIGCVEFKVTKYINLGYIKIGYRVHVFKEPQRTWRWINQLGKGSAHR